MPFSKNLGAMIKSLPTSTHSVTGDAVVEHFAILIETHQDNDGSVEQFRHSFIRGECAPIAVTLAPNTLELQSDDGRFVRVDYRRHRFVSHEAWSKFLMDYIMESGLSPIIGGVMPTRLLRDARASRNELRSFRQMVVHNYAKAKAAGTLVKP